MLLASLQRHAERLTTAFVDRDADNAPRNRTLVVVFGGEIGGVRAAIAHGYAETLSRANHDIGAHLARWLEQSKAHNVSGCDGNRVVLMQDADEITQVSQLAVHGGVLENAAKQRRRIDAAADVFGVANNQLEFETLGASLNNVDSLRIALAVDEKRVCLTILAHALGKCHRLGGGGGFV